MTIQYLKRLLTSDIETLLIQDKELRLGLNTYKGHVTNQGVAEALGYPYVDVLTVLP